MLIKETLDLVGLYLEPMNTGWVNLMSDFLWGSGYRADTHY